MVLAILAVSVVAVDHYTTHKVLTEFDEANKMNYEQFVDLCRATGTIQYAEKCQEIATIQARRIEKQDDMLSKFAAGVKQLREENGRLQGVLEESATTIKELTDENAKLGARLDVSLELLDQSKCDYFSAKKQIEELKATIAKNEVIIEELQKKLDASANDVKCLIDNAESNKNMIKALQAQLVTKKGS
jgi:predicted RNase H-like nuclease (RuvC/YqgF family)